MNTEVEILKEIAISQGKAHIRLIAKEAKISNDYARFICKALAGKGLIDQLQEGNWYQITAKGKRELGLEKKKPLQQEIKRKAKQINKNPGEREEQYLEQIIKKGVNKGIKKIVFCLTKCAKCIREIVKVDSKK